ncbi:MAG: hypothetical protein UT42_C0003G0001, partial [Candidatus Falkowbacteria bacterium GW2011_GWA2_39_24]
MKLRQQTLAWVVILSMVLWNFTSLYSVPPAQAVGGISAFGTNDDVTAGQTAGGTPDVYLNSTSTKEAFLAIEVYDSAGGTLHAVSVCLDEMNSFSPTTDLSGIELWNDNGGGSSNGVFTASGEGADTLLGAVTSYTTYTDSFAMGGTCQKVTFSALALAVPTSWSSKLKLFVVTTPLANLNTSPLKSFNPMIPVGGIDVTPGDGATIADWPTSYTANFPPVFLGDEGQGMYGAPLVISELQASGDDDDDEFIEIHNRSDQAVDLSQMNFTLAYAPANTVAGTDLTDVANWTSTVTLDTGTIPAMGFYLITGANGAGYDGGVAGNKTFASPFVLPIAGGIVGLFSPSDIIIDKMAYGSATAAQAEGGMVAPAPAANGSIERKAFPDSTSTKMASGGIHETKGNGEDSNNNYYDFLLRTTCGPQNASSTVEDSDIGYDENSTPVIINEVLYNVATTTGWVELYNRSAGTVDIAGWKIVVNGDTYTVPASKTIAVGTYATVFWNKTGTDTATSWYTSNSNGTTVDIDLAVNGGDVTLKNSENTIKDYVEYGGSGFANEASANSAATWMVGDYVSKCLYSQSMGRRSMTGEDSNSSYDWQCYSTTSPAAPNMGGDSTAPNAVSAVTLIDGDSAANSGLNGSDITVTWLPSSTPDPSFDKYNIYVLPSTTAFDDAVHTAVTNIYGGQYYGGNSTATYTWTGSSAFTQDSAGTTLANGSYKTYVIAVDFAGNRSGASGSAAATLTGEVYDASSDTQAPWLWHMSVWQAKLGADIKIMTGAEDDRALNDTNPIKIVWKQGTNASLPSLSSGATTTNCTAVEGNFYQCTISWVGLVEPTVDTVVGYYLTATDAATTPNVRYLASYWADNMSAATAQANPVYIDILAADNDTLGDYTDADSDPDLTGYVYRSDGSVFANDEQAKVFIEGTAVGYVTAINGTGAFTFADNTLIPGSANVNAFKSGYMDMFRSSFKGDSVTLYMNTDMGGGMMVAGSSNQPMVTWTAPGPGMQGAPINIYCTSDCSTVGAGETPVVIGFDRAMDANTINDTDASNAGSNIYLTTDGNDRVAGKVYYNSVTNEARFYATTANSLAVGTFYNIIVTQGVKDPNGNAIVGGMTADGSFSSGFNTMFDNTNMFVNGNYSTYGGGGATMPPYVMGTTPYPGSFDVSPNTTFLIEFNEPMDSSSITSDSIKLYPITSTSPWTLGTAVTATVTLDQATQRIVTLDPTSSLSTSYQWYELRIMGNVKNNMGVWFGSPSACSSSPDICLQNTMQYSAAFKITATNDSTKPTIIGNAPATNQGITAGTTAVGVGLGAIEMTFSEGMATSTITSSNITIKAGSNSVASTVEWDSKNNTARLKPSSALSANTMYTVTVGTGVTDLAGNVINTAYTFSFKTGASDVIAPAVLYANGDDYAVAVTFSESMNGASQTDTSNWSKSVINKANFTIKTVDGSGTGISPYATATSLSDVANVTLIYDNANNTTTIKGLALGSISGLNFQIFVDAVTDKSNNVIANTTGRVVTGSNAAQGPVQSSATTYSNLGPGGGGFDSPMMDMGTMGMMMAGAFPMNAMASKTTTYFVDIPTTKSIPSGGKILLTFPAGFDVTSAAKDANSPVNNDINERNAGTVTIASVAKDVNARTVTITTATAATQAMDYLHMDISGIINASVPRDFGTQGYSVDIKTFNASNVMLESVTTMPFFITQAGDYTLSGTITMRNGNDTGNVSVKTGQTMKVMLGSPMTGPQEATVTFDGDQNADFSFSGLPAAEYWLFTTPSVNVLSPVDASLEFTGYTQPESIKINETTDLSSDSSDNNVVDRDITLKQLDANAGTAVVVNLIGNFATDGIDDDVDIFANSYNNFRVKTLSNVGVQNGSTDYTLYLPDGDWQIGIGPAMSTSMMAGPPPMPDWMPPMPISVKVDADGSPAVSERSGTVNNGEISFDISAQVSKTIAGTVTNDSGTGIADAEVYAYQPNGGFGGSFTKTAANGTYTLKIMNAGTYMVGTRKPGLPSPQDKTVAVAGSNVTDVNFVMKQASYTISGKVLDANNNPMAYAPVWTHKTTGQGNANTMSNANGNYILYVDAGTWQVEGDIPGYGWTQYDTTTTISTASATDINLKPSSSTTWVTISGTVTINDSTQNYMPIRAVKYDALGNRLNREFGSSTDATGNYSISVPGGSEAQYYRIDIWTPDYGEVGLSTDGVANNPANVSVTNSNVTGKNITIAAENLKTVTITFDNKADYAGSEAFIHIDGVSFSGTVPSPTGFYKSIRVADLSGADQTIKLTAGDYFFFVDVPGYGGYAPKATSPAFDSDKKAITVDGTDDTVQFGLPDLDDAGAVITISGTITAEAGKNDAWVWVGNPATGFHTSQQANATTGAYSMVIPILSSGNYIVGADRPGYISSASVTNAGTADATIDFTLTVAAYTISGTIYNDADADGAYDSGEAIANGFVKAANATGAEAHSPTDGSGSFTLSVADGTWKLSGMANGYSESRYTEIGLPTNIVISGANASGNKNIKLTTNANWSNKTKSSSITPSSGGTIDDTAQNTTTGERDGTGLAITAPPNALGSSSSAGTVATATTAAVSTTDSTRPLGDSGVTVTATDNSGQPITNLDNYVDLEMIIYKADIDGYVTNGELVDLDKLKTMQVKYWDATVGDWVTLPTTHKAYHKLTEDTDWTLYNGTATQTGYDKFIDDALGATPTFLITTHYDDYKFVLSANTNHFTVFALGLSPDGVAPAAPTGLAQASGSGTSVGLTWTAVTTNADSSAISDLYGYAVYRSTDGVTYSQISASRIASGTETYTDSTTTAWTSYYYKITAGDDDDVESAYSTALQVCSTKTVTNGTVAANCAVTCNSGYVQSGNTCITAGGGHVIGGGGGGSSSTTTPTYQTYDPTTGETTTVPVTETPVTT